MAEKLCGVTFWAEVKVPFMINILSAVFPNQGFHLKGTLYTLHACLSKRERSIFPLSGIIVLVMVGGFALTFDEGRCLLLALILVICLRSSRPVQEPVVCKSIKSYPRFNLRLNVGRGFHFAF